MKRSDVLRLLLEKRGELSEKYGVKSLALFGSVARDEARPDSEWTCWLSLTNQWDCSPSLVSSNSSKLCLVAK